ncbi:MAG: SPOR domain-containing protein [Xanthomonadaceae bacterium]|nr:SPOR domain-containing protein [Xanthomonadaceae bacterium]
MDQWVGTLPVEASTPSAAATTPAPETRVITQSTGFSGRFGDDAGSAPAAAGAPPPATTGAAGSGQSKWLQIGSFASLENARRAMAQLSSAGIVGATLSDVESAGRTMWRLRVQSEESDVTELVRRLASLGFNQAQVVRE